MIPEEVRDMAAHCRHYAMCKVDYLGEGVCPSGEERRYVSYYPQGRMDLAVALADGKIPVTEGVLDIAETCDLCGRCEMACHFVTELSPVSVMRALKEHVAAHVGSGLPVERVPDDGISLALKEIVGAANATRDPGLLVAYSDDPSPIPGRMPRYVVLPRTRDEVVEIARLAREREIPWVVRGNGGSVLGFVMSEGIVIDVARMTDIEIDSSNWVAHIQPGVTTLDVQAAAVPQGMRMNAAELSATVCGNIVCTGVFSPWSNAYGMCADNLVDAEFVDGDGGVFRMSEKEAPNVSGFRYEELPAPGICTAASVRLHPVLSDEEGLLVPFAELEPAVSFARELSARRIGTAIIILGGHMLSAMMAISQRYVRGLRKALEEALGMRYAVVVVADSYARGSIREMTDTIIDQPLFRAIVLGQARLADASTVDIISSLESDDLPFTTLCRPELRTAVEAILSPSPTALASTTDAEHRAEYERIYSRPEMSDIAWLTHFRVMSARMCRRKHLFPHIAYLPLEAGPIERIMDGYAEIANTHGIDNEFVFLIPVDLGKRTVLEFDYYLDQTSEDEIRNVLEALPDLNGFMEETTRSMDVKYLKTAFAQGCSRKEMVFYS
jgi:hypothetical protein